MSAMKLAIAGAEGRMGRTLLRIVAESPDAEVVAALTHPESPALGEDAGPLAGLGTLGMPLSADPLAALVAADGLIDFTAPAATLGYAEIAAQARIVHVIGTTGFTPEDETTIEAAARHAVIVKSGNMSLGVNLLAGLVRNAARALGADFDIEIAEMHHRHKVDAPSGTALLLGRAAAEGRGRTLDELALPPRAGQTGARPQGGIGFAALRGGSVVGEHSVILAGEGERLELTHRAEDRAIFARGALKAALWGRGRQPGLYSMADVLGLPRE